MLGKSYINVEIIRHFKNGSVKDKCGIGQPPLGKAIELIFPKVW